MVNFMKEVFGAFILYHLMAIGHVCGEAGLLVAARLASPCPLDRLAKCQHPSVPQPTTSFAARVTVMVMLGTLSLCATEWLGATAVDPCALVAATITLALAINLVEHAADLVAPTVMLQAPAARSWTPKRLLLQAAYAVAALFAVAASRAREVQRYDRQHQPERDEASKTAPLTLTIAARIKASLISATLCLVVETAMAIGSMWQRPNGIVLCLAAVACPPTAPIVFAALTRRAKQRHRGLPRRPSRHRFSKHRHASRRRIAERNAWTQRMHAEMVVKILSGMHGASKCEEKHVQVEEQRAGQDQQSAQGRTDDPTETHEQQQETVEQLGGMQKEEQESSTPEREYDYTTSFDKTFPTVKDECLREGPTGYQFLERGQILGGVRARQQNVLVVLANTATGEGEKYRCVVTESWAGKSRETMKFGMGVALPNATQVSVINTEGKTSIAGRAGNAFTMQRLNLRWIIDKDIHVVDVQDLSSKEDERAVGSEEDDFPDEEKPVKKPTKRDRRFRELPTWQPIKGDLHLTKKCGDGDETHRVTVLRVLQPKGRRELVVLGPASWMKWTGPMCAMGKEVDDLLRNRNMVMTLINTDGKRWRMIDHLVHTLETEVKAQYHGRTDCGERQRPAREEIASEDRARKTAQRARAAESDHQAAPEPAKSAGGGKQRGGRKVSKPVVVTTESPSVRQRNARDDEEETETPLLFPMTETQDDATVTPEQPGPMPHLHVTENHPMLAHIQNRQLRVQVADDVNRGETPEASYNKRLQELGRSHRLLQIDHPAMQEVDEEIRVEVLAEIHQGETITRAQEIVWARRAAARAHHEEEIASAPLFAPESSDDDNGVEEEAESTVNGREAVEEEEEEFTQEFVRREEETQAAYEDEEREREEKEDAGAADEGAQAEDDADNDAAGDGGTQWEKQPCPSEPESSSASDDEHSANDGGEASEEESDESTEEEVSDDESQHAEVNSDDDGEQQERAEYREAEADFSQNTGPPQNEATGEKGENDDASGSENSFTTPRRQTRKAHLGTKPSPGHGRRSHLSSTRVPVTRSAAKVAESKAKTRAEEAIARKVAKRCMEKESQARGAPRGAPSDAAKPQAATTTGTKATQETAKPTTVVDASTTTKFAFKSLSSKEQPKLYDAEIAAHRPGVGCWWFALRAMLEMVDPSMEKWYVPEYVSRVGDPLVYCERRGLRVRKAEDWLKVEQQSEHELVNMRGHGQSKRLEEVARRGTVVGIVWYIAAAAENAHLGHYAGIVKDANGRAVMSEDGRPFEQSDMDAICEHFSRNVDMVVVQRKQGEQRKPSDADGSKRADAGVETAAQAFESKVAAAAQGEAGTLATELKKQRRAEGTAKGVETRAANAAASAAAFAAAPAAASAAASAAAFAAASAAAPVAAQAVNSAGGAQVSADGKPEPKSIQEKLDALPFRTNVVRFLPTASVPEVRRHLIDAFDGVKSCLDSTKKLTLPGRNRGRNIAAQAAGKREPAPERKERPKGGFSAEELTGRVEGIFRRGNRGKAFQVADSHRTRIEDGEEPDVTGKLGSLHPRAEPRDAMRTAPTSGMILTTDIEVYKAVMKIAKDKAPGPSGMTSDVLAQVVEYEHTHGGCEVLEKLTAVVRSVLNDDMSRDEAMAVRQIRLVALAKRKPDGTYKGVRPVAMSETILKIAAMVALAKCEHLGSKWEHQYGLRKGGVEPAIFRVTDGFRSGKRVRTFDASNAYNTVWRSAFFKELAMLDAEEVEALKAYANFAYGSASWATYEDTDGSLKRFYVERGVRQGDPGGALFFCMAIQPILMKLSEKYAGIEVLAYMDDIAFVADKDVSDKTFEEAAKMLIDEMAKIGLVLRTEHDTKGDNSPFRYLGGAVTKTSQETNAAVMKLRPLEGVDRVLEVLLKCDAQIAFELLRVCGIAKGGFVARVHGEEATGWLGEFDGKVLDFLSSMFQIGANQLDGSKHLRQTTKFGGQGITKWASTAATCHAAARAMQPMWKMSLPTTEEEIAALAESSKGHVSAIAMAAVENPLKEDQWVAIKKLGMGVPHNTRATAKDAGGDLPCMGCKKLYADVDKLTTHAIQCPQASGEGNVTRRHNAVCDVITRQARKYNKLARREVPIVCLGRDGKQRTRYGDVVINDHFCIDVTVTNKPVDRLYDKVSKYQDAVNNKSMKFHVLAFTPEGRIHKYSLGFAQRLAKSCGMPFSDFWAPVATEVLRGTARSIIETARFVSDIAEKNRQNQAAAAVSHQASMSTLPAPLPTMTTALVGRVNSQVGAAATSAPQTTKQATAAKSAAITSVPSTTNTNAQGVAAPPAGNASTTAPKGAAGSTK